MPQRPRPRRASPRTIPMLPPQSLPGFVGALLLPPAVLLAAKLVELRLGWHSPAALLAAGAAAFIPAAIALAAAERRRGRSRPGAPAPSLERERLAALTAGEIARPLDDLVAAPADAAPGAVLGLMRRSGRRWIPLFRERLERVEGAVPLRHLVLPHDAGAPSRSLAVPVARVHRDLDALSALEALLPGSPPALVEDEGRVVGFFTRHDILEAAVGPLPRGALVERPAWLSRGPGAVASARIPMAELLRRLGRPSGGGDATLAEALRERLGRPLGPGESIEWEGLRFSVEEFAAHEPVRFRIERVEKGR